MTEAVDTVVVSLSFDVKDGTAADIVKQLETFEQPPGFTLSYVVEGDRVSVGVALPFTLKDVLK